MLVIKVQPFAKTERLQTIANVRKTCISISNMKHEKHYNTLQISNYKTSFVSTSSMRSGSFQNGNYHFFIKHPTFKVYSSNSLI